jgi:predicted nuclease with TOPRIM domain
MLASLNKVKKNFGAFSEVQKTIDADKAKLDELRQQRKDPEVQELSDKYEAIKKELDDLKLEQDAA